MRVSRPRMRLLHLVTCVCPICSHECDHMRVSHEAFLEFRKQFSMLSVRVLALVYVLFLSLLSSNEHMMQFRIPCDLCEVSSALSVNTESDLAEFALCVHTLAKFPVVPCVNTKCNPAKCALCMYTWGKLFSGVFTQPDRFLAPCLLRMRTEASMVLVCPCRSLFAHVDTASTRLLCMKTESWKFLYLLHGHDTASSRQD